MPQKAGADEFGAFEKNRQIVFELRLFPDETRAHTHTHSSPVKEGGEVGSMLKEEGQQETDGARLSLSLCVSVCLWASVYLPLSTTVTRPDWEAAREEEEQHDGPPDSVCVCADVSDVHHCVSALEERYDRTHCLHQSMSTSNQHASA